MKKRRIIAAAGVIVLTLCAVCFRPRTLREILRLTDRGPEETAYCTFWDISQGDSKSWAGSAGELAEPAGGFLWLDQVYVAGPVFYKSSSVNSDLFNLYFALPQPQGGYRQITVELILSRDRDSAFININGGGYIVTSGAAALKTFVQNVRNTHDAFSG